MMIKPIIFYLIKAKYQATSVKFAIQCDFIYD